MIDLTEVMSALIDAMAIIVWWLQTHYIHVFGETLSIFDVVLTACSVSIILDAFIPWDGAEDEENE